MARGTKEQAAINKQKIIDATFEITIEEGFENATFSNISQRAGLSRSGVNAHFSKKTDILKALNPRFEDMIKSCLCFDSPADFKESWMEEYEKNLGWRNVVTQYFPSIDPVRFSDICSLIKGDEQEARQALYMCIGFSFYRSEVLNNNLHTEPHVTPLV